MISFVIPAYNEEAALPQTLAQVHLAARAVGDPYEVIVVDDGSKDRTAAVAAAQGARVLSVQLRQIAATRNAGARAARGETLVFLDADTLLPEATLRSALAAIEAGAVGGGAGVAFDGSIPVASRIPVAIILSTLRLAGWAAGCFVFVRRSAFEAVGGFDERYFASEEIHLSRALKTQGRFLVLREKTITSARKLRLLSPWQLGKSLLRMTLAGSRGLKRREGLDVWYDGDLREPGIEPAEPAERR